MLALLVLGGCGEANPAPDGSHPDAPAAGLQLAPFSRQGAPFEPLATGSTLPFFSGFQGFRLFDLQVRAPASLAATSPVPFTLAVVLVDAGLGPFTQSGDLPFSLPPSNGTRDSDRYVMYLNEVTELQLEGASCRVTATLGPGPAPSTAEVTVRLYHSSCVDYGDHVVCPDAGP